MLVKGYFGASVADHKGESFPHVEHLQESKVLALV